MVLGEVTGETLTQERVTLGFFFHPHPSVSLSSISPRTWVLENGNCFCCSAETSLLRNTVCPELVHRLTQSHWLVPSQAGREPGRCLALLKAASAMRSNQIAQGFMQHCLENLSRKSASAPQTNGFILEISVMKTSTYLSSFIKLRSERYHDSDLSQYHRLPPSTSPLQFRRNKNKYNKN